MPMPLRLMIPLLWTDKFSPLELSNLVAWYYANDASTLYQDSAKTTPAGIGDPVGAWADKSGNGNDALQNTGANKPTRQSGYVAGDGVSDYLAITLPADSSRTIFIKGVEDDTLVGSMRIWGITAVASIYGNGTNFSWFAKEGGGSVDFLDAHGTLQALGVRISSASDGQYESAAGSSVSFDPDDAATSTANMGLFAESVTGGNSGEFRIYEFLVYDRALTDAEITRILNYMS